MRIPEHVRQLLWEYDLESEAETSAIERVVFERVMERGGWREMRWLLEHHPRSRLRTFLETRGHRVLPARELRFWSLACGVPDPVADEWVAVARTRERAWRGPV